MKRIIMLLGAIVASSSCFAVAEPSKNNSSPLKSMLSSAWKAPQPRPKLDKNDINMVYGGADISRKPTLALHTVAA